MREFDEQYWPKGKSSVELKGARGQKKNLPSWTVQLTLWAVVNPSTAVIHDLA